MADEFVREAVANKIGAVLWIESVSAEELGSIIEPATAQAAVVGIMASD